MSWSVSAIGKPAAVAVKVAEEFKRCACVEPEESVRQAAGALIAEALAAQGPDVAVLVSASGHQGQSYGQDGKPNFIHNSLRVVVEPQHGFVE